MLTQRSKARNGILEDGPPVVAGCCVENATEVDGSIPTEIIAFVLTMSIDEPPAPAYVVSGAEVRWRNNLENGS